MLGVIFAFYFSSDTQEMPELLSYLEGGLGSKHVSALEFSSLLTVVHCPALYPLPSSNYQGQCIGGH